MSDIKQKREKTGLHDIYGNELYVGDIYKWILPYQDREHYLFVVERVVPGQVECSGWLTTPARTPNPELAKQVFELEYNSFNDLITDSYNLEKIGNIYDNPELVAQLQPLQG